MPVASIAREFTPQSDDSGLRTALRNVPLLPAPANVDDLLARLDAEEVPFSSGPIAELISDARHIEPAPADDGFFAPVSLAANTNRRRASPQEGGERALQRRAPGRCASHCLERARRAGRGAAGDARARYGGGNESRSRPRPRCAGRGRGAGSGVTGGERPAARHRLVRRSSRRLRNTWPHRPMRPPCPRSSPSRTRRSWWSTRRLARRSPWCSRI